MIAKPIRLMLFRCAREYGECPGDDKMLKASRPANTSLVPDHPEQLGGLRDCQFPGLNYALPASPGRLPDRQPFETSTIMKLKPLTLLAAAGLLASGVQLTPLAATS